MINETEHNKKMELKKQEDFDLDQIKAEETAVIVEKPAEKPADTKGADGISFGGIPKFLGSKGTGKPMDQALFPEIGGTVDPLAQAAEKRANAPAASSTTSYGGGRQSGPPSFSGTGAGKNRFGDFKGSDPSAASSEGSSSMFGKGPAMFSNSGAKKGTLGEWSKQTGGNEALDKKIEEAQKEAEEKRERDQQ